MWPFKKKTVESEAARGRVAAEAFFFFKKSPSLEEIMNHKGSAYADMYFDPTLEGKAFARAYLEVIRSQKESS